MDAGLKPAAVFGQRTYLQQLNIVGEVYTESTESMGMDRFVTTRLLPYIRTRFPHARPIVVADPSITQRSQANEVTAYDILARYFTVHTAPSDRLEPRINAAENWFAGQVNGKPKILLDPHTPYLQGALAHGYRYEKKRMTGVFTAGETKDTPEKNNWSHIADAFMYLCMYTGGAPQHLNQHARPVVIESAVGWT
jgi:hypothetical protein